MEGSNLAIILPLLLPVLVSGYLLIYIARRRASVDIPLALIILTAVFWSGGYAVELSATSLKLKLFAERMEYLGLVIGPTGWFLLGLELRNRMDIIGRKSIAALAVIPVATLVMVFTSDMQDFFWRSKSVAEFNGLTLLVNEYGPGFWIHTIYSYVLNLAGAALILTAVFRTNAFYLRQRIAIITALLLPWIANIIFIFRLTDYPVDFSPFALVGSSIILVLVVFRYGLGDLVPVAREKIIAEMQDAVLVLDEQMRVVDYNRALSSLLDGIPVSVGQSAEELFGNHPKLLVLLSRTPEQVDLVYTGFGDRVHRVSTEIISSNTGADARLVIIRDLSADSRAQDALRLVVESTSGNVGEDFYQSLVRSLSKALDTKFAMLTTIDEENADTARTLALWNGIRMEENFDYSLPGTPSEEVLQRGTCIFPDKVAEQFPGDGLLAEWGIVSYLGTTLRSHAGSPIGLLCVMDVEPFESAEVGITVLELFGMRAATEIERRYNEQALEASEENYRRIVETTKDGVCATDRQGRILFTNGQLSKLLSPGREVMTGLSLPDLFTVENESADIDLLRPENSNLEFSLINSQGEMKHVSVSKTVIEDAGEVQAGLLFVFADITEQYLLKEANRGIEEQLRHAQKMESLGVLAGGVAHDFNNLLVPVLGYIDLIRQRTRDDPVVTKYLDQTELAGEKLADLCTQMLTYSGKGQFVETVVDLNAKVTEMQGLIRASVPKNVSIEYAISPKPVTVEADETQLSQVMMNLVINAGEAMQEVSTGTITISTGEDILDEEEIASLSYGDFLVSGRYAWFEVRDEGVGISADDQSRLFEPFFTTKFTGRGLGMAVVYGILRAHHGAIRIRSREGEGAAIRVFFPVSKELPENGDPTVEQVAEHGTGSGKVLVVDDESFVRELFRGMLASLGLEAIEAANGQQGLQRFVERQSEISMCIIDMTMPGMGGDELSRKIASHDENLPILLVSGYSQIDVFQKDARVGNIAFLQKPFSLQQFRKAVEQQLSRTGVRSPD